MFLRALGGGGGGGGGYGMAATMMAGAGRMAWLSATRIFGAGIVFDMLVSAPDHESLGRKGIDDHYDFIIGN